MFSFLSRNQKKDTKCFSVERAWAQDFKYLGYKLHNHKVYLLFIVIFVFVKLFFVIMSNVYLLSAIKVCDIWLKSLFYYLGGVVLAVHKKTLLFCNPPVLSMINPWLWGTDIPTYRSPVPRQMTGNKDDLFRKWSSPPLSLSSPLRIWKFPKHKTFQIGHFDICLYLLICALFLSLKPCCNVELQRWTLWTTSKG